jgi:hypothetical protein
MARRAVAEVPLEDFNESLNIMIHAMPGAGKTRLGATAPNSVFLSSEPGVISARRARAIGGVQGVVKCRKWQDAVDFVDAAENGDFAHRDWIVVDTISTLQEKDMKSILEKAVSDNPNRDPDIPALQDYMKMQNSFMRWFERMIDLPQNVLFLSHTMRVDDSEGDTLLIPSIQGGADKGYKVANYCMGLVNLVGFMDRKTVKDGKATSQVRRLLWQPYYDEEREIRYTAKDHFDALGFTTDDWDMPMIIEAIESSGVKEDKPATKKTAARRVRS